VKISSFLLTLTNSYALASHKLPRHLTTSSTNTPSAPLSSSPAAVSHKAAFIHGHLEGFFH
jgi:hypothetical protein